MNSLKNYWQRVCIKAEKQSPLKFFFFLMLKICLISTLIALLTTKALFISRWITEVIWSTILITALWGMIQVKAFEKTHPEKDKEQNP